MNNLIPITAAVSGYRPSKLRAASGEVDICNTLKGGVSKSIVELYTKGYRRFMVGGAQGFDMICAECIIELLQEHGDIQLIIAAPFQGQEQSYPPADRLRYLHIIERAHEVHYLSPTPSKEAFLYRNKFMLQHSSLLLCYYDGQRGGTMHTYNRAKRLGLKIINLCSHFHYEQNPQGSLF